jgi:molybdenum cofactor guanylyltransferase
MNLENGKVSAYILAGGASTRMGSNKAFLSLNGKTFLEVVAERIESAFGTRPCVVTSERNKSEFSEWEIYFRILSDSIPDLGPISGFHAALSDSSGEFTAIIAIDMPTLNPMVFQKLLTMLEESGKDAVCLRIEGTVQPMPSIYRTAKALATLEAGIMEGRIFSPAYLLDGLDALIIESSHPSFSSERFENINLPSDLENLTAPDYEQPKD